MKKRMIFIIPMIVFVGILILFQTVFFIGYVPTASMEPTLKENSIVFGSRIFGDLSVGDNSNSKQCIGIEGCVNLSKRIILKEIDVKHVLTGRLYMDDKSIDPDCFGKEYLIKNAKKVKGIEYYDSSQKLYGFGDIEIDLPIYQFAINQYVKIDEDGKLVAIYLKFS